MKINYRPEIDGLRAIAVVTVIIYHTEIFLLDHRIFGGGFVGVDIFFVISGYLITSIIYKELVTTGVFSFKNFYQRRIRRIIPMLLFVILVSLPFAWIYLLPHSLIDFSKSVLYSLGFSSNFYFWQSGAQYGAESSLFKPFLHTWSLSVEEQYYILFPIIFLLTFRYFKKYLIHILVLGFFISIGCADWGSRNYATFNFYVLPTRGWELIAGSILAYFEIKLRHRNKNKKLALFLPATGLILVMHSMLFFHDEIFHPSFYTLSPIIGVCLIIWYSDKDELITKILSSKLFVGVGLISYSLYLWHFPILAFARVTGFLQEDNTSVKLLLIIIILFLSILSYFFIERPFRNKEYKFTFIIKFLVTITLFIFIFNIASIYKKGFEKRSHFPELIINAYKTLGYRVSSQNGIKCDDRIGKDGFCIFNELSDNVGDIILLGDSMGDALLKSLREQVSNTKFRLITMTYGGWLYLPGFIKYNNKDKSISLDETVNKYRTDFIKNKAHKNSYIIIYGKYSSHFGKKLQFDGEKVIKNKTSISLFERNNINLDFHNKKKLLKKKFKDTIINLSKDYKVILLYPSPVSTKHVFYNILGSKSKLINPDVELYLNNPDYYLLDKMNYSTQSYKEFFSEEISLFDSINSKNIYKIKLEKTFCPEDRCLFYDNKDIYIYDTHHPSYEGSKKINRLIMETINQSLAVKD